MHRHPVQSIIFQIEFCQRTVMTYKYDILKHFQEKNQHYMSVFHVFEKLGKNSIFIYVNYFKIVPLESWQNSTSCTLVSHIISKERAPSSILENILRVAVDKMDVQKFRRVNIWSRKRKSKLNFSQFYCSFFQDILFSIDLFIFILLENWILVWF